MKKYTDEERNEMRRQYSGLVCYDCKLRYNSRGFCDILVPDDIWEQINPTYHKGAGILCFNCIAGRLDDLELPELVSCKIRSGPFKTYEQT